MSKIWINSMAQISLSATEKILRTEWIAIQAFASEWHCWGCWFTVRTNETQVNETQGSERSGSFVHFKDSFKKNRSFMIVTPLVRSHSSGLVRHTHSLSGLSQSHTLKVSTYIPTHSGTPVPRAPPAPRLPVSLGPRRWLPPASLRLFASSSPGHLRALFPHA